MTEAAQDDHGVLLGAHSRSHPESSARYPTFTIRVRALNAKDFKDFADHGGLNLIIQTRQLHEGTNYALPGLTAGLRINP